MSKGRLLASAEHDTQERLQGGAVARQMDNGIVAAFALAAAMACNVLTARGDGLDWSPARQPASDAMTPMIDPATIASWHALAAQVRANQPAWSSPLITTTGMLEQRFRFDLSEQHAGNGANTTAIDGGRGLDLIVSNSNEVQIAAPPYDIRSTRLASFGCAAPLR